MKIKEGKINEPGFIRIIKTFTGEDPEKLKIAADVIAECSLITDDDLCNAAVKIGKCIGTKSVEKNLIFAL